jgi:hypothetical protein
MKRVRKGLLLAAVIAAVSFAAPAAAVVSGPAAAASVAPAAPATHRAAAVRATHSALTTGTQAVGQQTPVSRKTPKAAGNVALAAPGCYGASCQGQFATAMGCTADRIEVGGFHSPANSTWAAADFTVWHSIACHSAWAEYDSAGDGSGRLEIFIFNDEYGRSSDDYQVLLGPAGNYPTRMVPWDDSVQVCGDTFLQQCSGWR